MLFTAEGAETAEEDRPEVLLSVLRALSGEKVLTNPPESTLVP